MKKIYVIGNRASKSLSPTIFNFWFKKYNIKAKYSFLELNTKNFDKKTHEVLKDNNVIGLNITIPFKNKILKHTDVLDKHAEEINAVNCVLKKNRKIIGTNTDWKGYYKTLPKSKNLKGKKVIIIGYGGAALAIHYVLKTKGFKNINIYNRTRKKLRFEEKTNYTKNLTKLDKDLVDADLIINTTPLDLVGKKNTHLISKKTLLSDIVYLPKETDFLKKYPSNKKIYGIEMLVEQAALCFKLWFGFKPAPDLELNELLDFKLK